MWGTRDTAERAAIIISSADARRILLEGTPLLVRQVRACVQAGVRRVLVLTEAADAAAARDQVEQAPGDAELELLVASLPSGSDGGLGFPLGTEWAPQGAIVVSPLSLFGAGLLEMLVERTAERTALVVDHDVARVPDMDAAWKVIAAHGAVSALSGEASNSFPHFDALATGVLWATREFFEQLLFVPGEFNHSGLLRAAQRLATADLLSCLDCGAHRTVLVNSQVAYQQATRLLQLFGAELREPMRASAPPTTVQWPRPTEVAGGCRPFDEPVWREGNFGLPSLFR